MNRIKKIALFASGSGSNAENIVRYFTKSKDVCFPFILSNKVDAYVHKRAMKLKIRSFTASKNEFENGKVLQLLQEFNIDFIVLAGFLLKIPSCILKIYPNKIINIHPSLLPKYGGKGMYGLHVHRAIVANKETVSGITIHYVNEQYDKGQIIFQIKCTILPIDSPENIENKVRKLEHIHFPKVIEDVINKSTI